MTGPVDTVEAREFPTNQPCSTVSIYSPPPVGAGRLEEGGRCVASPSSCGRASVYLSNRPW